MPTQKLINEVVDLIGDDSPEEFCRKAGIEPYPPLTEEEYQAYLKKKGYI